MCEVEVGVVVAAADRCLLTLTLLLPAGGRGGSGAKAGQKMPGPYSREPGESLCQGSSMLLMAPVGKPGQPALPGLAEEGGQGGQGVSGTVEELSILLPQPSV